MKTIIIIGSVIFKCARLGRSSIRATILSNRVDSGDPAALGNRVVVDSSKERKCPTEFLGQVRVGYQNVVNLGCRGSSAILRVRQSQGWIFAGRRRKEIWRWMGIKERRQFRKCCCSVGWVGQLKFNVILRNNLLSYIFSCNYCYSILADFHFHSFQMIH